MNKKYISSENKTFVEMLSEMLLFGRVRLRRFNYTVFAQESPISGNFYLAIKSSNHFSIRVKPRTAGMRGTGSSAGSSPSSPCCSSSSPSPSPSGVASRWFRLEIICTLRGEGGGG